MKKKFGMGVYQKIMLLLRIFRVYFLSTFKPEYVERSIKQRRGKCPKDCTAPCCWDCEHLEDGRCVIYEDRPQHCRDAPIDRWDQWLFLNIFKDAKCNFRWESGED